MATDPGDSSLYAEARRLRAHWRDEVVRTHAFIDHARRKLQEAQRDLAHIRAQPFDSAGLPAQRPKQQSPG